MDNRSEKENKIGISIRLTKREIEWMKQRRHIDQRDSISDVYRSAIACYMAWCKRQGLKKEVLDKQGRECD